MERERNEKRGEKKRKRLPPEAQKVGPERGAGAPPETASFMRLCALGKAKGCIMECCAVVLVGRAARSFVG